MLLSPKKCEMPGQCLSWKEVWDERSCHSSLSPSSLTLWTTCQDSEPTDAHTLVCPISRQAVEKTASASRPDGHSLLTAPLLLPTEQYYLVLCLWFLEKRTTFVWVGAYAKLQRRWQDIYKGREDERMVSQRKKYECTTTKPPRAGIKGTKENINGLTKRETVQC